MGIRNIIDCADIKLARLAYRSWRERGYTKESSRRMTAAATERDEVMGGLNLWWTITNTNQADVARSIRKLCCK